LSNSPIGRAALVGVGIGLVCGTSFVIVTFISSDPELNWTTPRPQHNTVAGWYHAAFLVITASVITSLVFSVANIRRVHSAHNIARRDADRLILHAAWFGLTGFVTLLLWDHYTVSHLAMLAIGISAGVLFGSFNWLTDRRSETPRYYLATVGVCISGAVTFGAAFGRGAPTLFVLVCAGSSAVFSLAFVTAVPKTWKTSLLSALMVAAPAFSLTLAAGMLPLQLPRIILAATTVGLPMLLAHTLLAMPMKRGQIAGAAVGIFVVQILVWFFEEASKHSMFDSDMIKLSVAALLSICLQCAALPLIQSFFAPVTEVELDDELDFPKKLPTMLLGYTRITVTIAATLPIVWAVEAVALRGGYDNGEKWGLHPSTVFIVFSLVGFSGLASIFVMGRGGPKADKLKTAEGWALTGATAITLSAVAIAQWSLCHPYMTVWARPMIGALVVLLVPLGSAALVAQAVGANCRLLHAMDKERSVAALQWVVLVGVAVNTVGAILPSTSTTDPSSPAPATPVSCGISFAVLLLIYGLLPYLLGRAIIRQELVDAEHRLDNNPPWAGLLLAGFLAMLMALGGGFVVLWVVFATQSVGQAIAAYLGLAGLGMIFTVFTLDKNIQFLRQKKRRASKLLDQCLSPQDKIRIRRELSAMTRHIARQNWIGFVTLFPATAFRISLSWVHDWYKRNTADGKSPEEHIEASHRPATDTPPHLPHLSCAFMHACDASCIK